MTTEALQQRFEELRRVMLPFPGGGATPERHTQLFAIAREDVSLAKLAEAHWDAHAILAEAGHSPRPNALYAVWASEIPGRGIMAGNGKLNGSKPFATGIGRVDRALVTLESGQLLDLNVRHPGISGDLGAWKTTAFASTSTGVLHVKDVPFHEEDLVGSVTFYTGRPGFWHGACGPAACWAGGVAGLLEFADRSTRRDPHTLAHLAAMHANVWAMRAALDAAGREIDDDPENYLTAHQRALRLRHIVEQLATDTLRRFLRAFGPHPLALDETTSQRYLEVDLFLRQCHAERDLEALGRLLTEHP